MDHHFECVADLEGLGFDREREFAERQYAFGFSADVDEQFVLIFLDDHAVEDLSFVEDLERFFVEALLERELIFFFFVPGAISVVEMLSSYLNYFIFADFIIADILGTTTFRAVRSPFERSGWHIGDTSRRVFLDGESVLKTAPQPIRVHVIVDAGPALVDRSGQYVHDCAVQSANRWFRQRLGGSAGTNPSVPNASHA